MTIKRDFDTEPSDDIESAECAQCGRYTRFYKRQPTNRCYWCNGALKLKAPERSRVFEEKTDG